jgi:hypothetical protein
MNDDAEARLTLIVIGSSLTPALVELLKQPGLGLVAVVADPVLYASPMADLSDSSQIQNFSDTEKESESLHGEALDPDHHLFDDRRADDEIIVVRNSLASLVRIEDVLHMPGFKPPRHHDHLLPGHPTRPGREARTTKR